MSGSSSNAGSDSVGPEGASGEDFLLFPIEAQAATQMRGDLQAPSACAPVLQPKKPRVREGEVTPPKQPDVLFIHHCSGLAACQAAAARRGQCGDQQT